MLSRRVKRMRNVCNASLILFGYLLHFVDLLIIQEDEGSFCVLPCIFFIIIRKQEVLHS